MLFYWFKIGVWFVGIEDFVAVHDCHEIFCIRKVYYVMGVSRKHVDSLNLISGNFKIQHIVASDSSLLDKSMSAYDDEEFPFCVVPMLSFGDSWLGYIYADLSAIECMDEFGK